MVAEVFVIIERGKNDRRRILYAILYEILIGTGKMIAAHKIEHFLQKTGLSRKIQIREKMRNFVKKFAQYEQKF